MGDLSMTPQRLDVTRRRFLVGSTGAGVMMAFGLGALARGQAAEELAAKRFAPTVWFEMGADGVTQVNIAKAEMGQHVGTALARVVAEELEVAWDDVRIVHVDTDPKWGYMVTGGSWSVFTTFAQLSQAGAAGRVALIEAGAQMLDAPVEECSARDSRVVHGENSVSYAEIVQAGALDREFSEEELTALPMKPATERRYLGAPGQALDIPEKTNGAAQFGIDVSVPGMVYARPVVPPTRLGSRVVSVDDSAAQEVPGYITHVVLNDPSDTLQGWVSVVAESFPAAIKAADALQVEYETSPSEDVSEETILAEGDRLCADPAAGALWVSDGDVDAARAAAARSVEGRYTTATALHFQLEPVNALAFQDEDGIWRLHCGNQWQSLILPTLAASLEVEESQIVIHQYYLGGGFGRRLWGDYMIPAALTSKALGRPVKMVFTRPDDSRFDCPRSASVQTFAAAIDDAGALTAIDHAAAAGWPTLTLAPGFMPDAVEGEGKVDTFSISGADHWYTLANHRVRAINNPVAQSTFVPGWLRSVGPGWVNWGTESFLDEVAHELGQDPAALRLTLLDATGKNAGEAPHAVGGASRLAAVLRRAMDKAGWGGDLPADTALGVACAFGQERTMPTWTACIARVRVDRATGAVTPERITQVIDCGTVVHPDGALAQAEGATLWGVSLALHEGSRFDAGDVADRNLDTYTPLRQADVPDLDIEFMDSAEVPVGMGEPPTVVVAPAIGNAIYQAVGVRMRHLPIRADDVLAALDA